MIVTTTASRLRVNDRFAFAGATAVVTEVFPERNVVLAKVGDRPLDLRELPRDMVMVVERIGEFEHGERVIEVAKEIAIHTGSRQPWKDRTEEERAELRLIADLAIYQVDQTVR